jgi:hypothetical protein
MQGIAQGLLEGRKEPFHFRIQLDVLLGVDLTPSLAAIA